MASASETAAEEGNASPDVMHHGDGVGFLDSLRHFPLRKLSISPKGDSGAIFRYSHTRFSSRRFRKRIVFKNGDCNVVQGNVAKRRRRYLQDIFTTLVDVQWRWTLLVFALNFLLSWLCFAVVWWVIAFAHGDLDVGQSQQEGTEEQISSWIAAEVTESLPETTVDSLLVEFGSGGGESTPDGGVHSGGIAIDEEEGKEDRVLANQERTPCVTEIHGFASCFLFSVETQHTIGYGSRSTTEECPEAIFVMCLQSITGVMIQAFMVGIVFAKLSRPKKRTQTLLFSRNAVVCQRDGRLCFMFRVGDMRKSHIIEAHVRAQLIRRKVTKEGELLPFFQQELRVGCGDGNEDRLLFIWPTLIVHVIDDSSPLYEMSAADLSRERLEIIVILEGVIESTGMTTQARSSYLPAEILWGNRFRTLVTFRKESGGYEVDYSLFNDTYKVDTPLCSAKTLDELREMQQSTEDPVDEPKFLARRPKPQPQLAAIDVPLFGTVDEEEEEEEEEEEFSQPLEKRKVEDVGTTGKLAAAVALSVGFGVAALSARENKEEEKGEEEVATASNWKRQNGGGGSKNSDRGADVRITPSVTGLSATESVI